MYLNFEFFQFKLISNFKKVVLNMIFFSLRKLDMQIFQINIGKYQVQLEFGQGDQYPLTLFTIKLIVKNDSLMRFPLSCMKFMEPKIGQKSALISVCTLFDCKMYLFKSKLRQFPHWLNVGKSKQKNWRAYWSWLLSVSFTGLNFRFTKHIRLKMILCNLTLYPSPLDFGNIQFEKSSSANWIFCLF